MFKLKLDDINLFKNSFDAISSIVDEIQIQCDNDGLRLFALDRGHITFIEFELNESIFTEYECSEPEQINLDAVEFMKILKRGKNDDTLELGIDEGNIIITFHGTSTRIFKIRLIDMEYETPKPPIIEHPCKITIPSTLMKDSLNDIGLFSDRISITINEDYLIAGSDGDFGDSTIKYLHGEHITEVAKSTFALEKLQEIFKASKFSETCELNIGEDMPLIVNFRLITGEGFIKFLLAPRVDAED